MILFRKPVIRWAHVAITLALTSFAGRADQAGVKRLWTHSPGENTLRQLLVDDGKVFLFTSAGTVRRLDPSTGKPLSEVNLGAVAAAMPALDGQNVLVTATDGSVGMYSLASGKALWRKTGVAGQFSDPVLTGTAAYIGTGGDFQGVKGFRLTNGATVLSTALPHSVLSAPAVQDGILLAGTVGGAVCAIDLRSANVVGTVATSGEFYHQAIFFSGRRALIAPSGDERKVSAIDIEADATPREAWALRFGRPDYVSADLLQSIAVQPPLVRKQALHKTLSSFGESFAANFDAARDFIPTGPVRTSAWTVCGTEASLVVKEPGFPPQAMYTVVSVDIASGNRLITYERLIDDAPYSWCLPPVITQTSILACLGRSTIVSVSKITGKPEWEYRMGERSIERIAVTNGILLAKVRSDSVIALRFPIAGPVPPRFALYQNWPNPFRGHTVIRYALPVAARVRFLVFNSLGQQIAVLVSGRKTAGYHTVIWDGRDGRIPRASGVYHAKLYAGTYTKAIRMTLVAK